MAILTRAQAKAQIARVLGNATDTELLSEAQDALAEALEELSLNDFEWLTSTRSPDLSLVQGTDDYDLPADFRKIYSMRLVTNRRALIYIEQRLWDRVVFNPGQVQVPIGYTLFPRTSNTQARIRFLPIPSVTDTVRIKYYRLVTIPTTEGETLDIVERYQHWPIHQARASILAAHGENESRISYWQGRADRLMEKMREEDRWQPDRDEFFQPAAATRAVFPLDHPAYVLNLLDRG